MSTKLSVNVNKIATLRNARGKNLPDVLQTSLDLISFGAEGITVHPRPDGRHIRKEDVYQLSENISVEFNIEGYPSEDFLDLVEKVRPAQCTLVPDPPHVLTSNAGWKITENLSLLQNVCKRLKDRNVRTSIFVDPMDLTLSEIEKIPQTGTNRVELYTEAYADAFGTAREDQTLSRFKESAETIFSLGVEINAGHDLNLKNLRKFLTAIPIVSEVSIGHALISDALYLGLEETVRRYLRETKRL